MAIIDCPQCGEKISNNRKECQHCGVGLPKKQGKFSVFLRAIKSGIKAARDGFADSRKNKKPRRWRRAALLGAGLVVLIFGPIVYDSITQKEVSLGTLQDALEDLESNYSVMTSIKFNPDDAEADVIRGRELFFADLYRDASKPPSGRIYFDKKLAVQAVKFDAYPDVVGEGINWYPFEFLENKGTLSTPNLAYEMAENYTRDKTTLQLWPLFIPYRPQSDKSWTGRWASYRIEWRKIGDDRSLGFTRRKNGLIVDVLFGVSTADKADIPGEKSIKFLTVIIRDEKYTW